MIPRLKKVKQKKSKLKAKARRGKYIWELEKERKKEIDWSKYIKVKVPVIPIKYTEFKGKVFSGGQGKKYGFARVVKVKKSNRKHTAHILRLATERQLAPRPAMILSSENYDFETAMEKIKNLHAKRGKQRIAYLEIYCAFENENLLKNYVKELSEKFNAEVFGVVHTDESVPHCHILVSWANKEGKAIRLKRGDFKRLWATTIQRLQPSRLLPQKKGEGLPRTPYWIYRKAWLQDYDTYAQFCFDQWRQWELFYKWLNEYNWDIEPPFRRRFFKTWLWQEGYEPQPEEIEEVNPFEILKELTSKLAGRSEPECKLEPDKLASSPQGDKQADVKQAEDKQAEGLRYFTTTEAPKENEVVVGGGEVVALVPEVVSEVVSGPEVMVVAKEEIKEEMVAMKVEPSEAIEEPKDKEERKTKEPDIKEPLEEKEDKKLEDKKEEKEPVVVAKEKVPQGGTKLEDRKDEVVAMVKEPNKKEAENRKEKIVVATATKKEPKDRKEPKKTEEPDIVVAKKETKKTKESKEKERIEEKVVLAKKETEDRKETKESKVMVANIKTEDKEENRKEKLVMVAIEDKKEIEDRKELDMVAKKEIEPEPKEDKDKKEPDMVATIKTEGKEENKERAKEEWSAEDLWTFMKEREKEKKKQIKELEALIFKSFNKVKSYRKARGAK